ncbi:MAG: hypothetical protein QNJ51_22925 [Calothrix sp. MO_167.B12]|nr:hypothetical protein [Calothrix sp. MO_167.B12]
MNTDIEKQAIQYLQQQGGQTRLNNFAHQSILKSLIAKGLVHVVLQKPDNDQVSTWFVRLVH